MGKYGSTDPAVFINRDMVRRVTRLEKALDRANARIKIQAAAIIDIQENIVAHILDGKESE